MSERGGEGFLTHAAEKNLRAENLSLQQQLEGEKCAGRVASQQIESLVQQLEEAKEECRQADHAHEAATKRYQVAEQQLERVIDAGNELATDAQNAAGLVAGSSVQAWDKICDVALAELEKGEA